jgi:hypothetical protein
MRVASFLLRGLSVSVALLVLSAPARALEAQSDIISAPYTNDAFGAVQIVNDVVGARTFYDAGYFGQRTIIANVEAGHVWSGHEVFARSSFGLPNAPSLLLNATRDVVTAPDLGDVDFHATMVGNVLAGTGDIGGGSLSLFGAGVAPLATLWSGAIATKFDRTPENLGSFEISDESFLTPYRAFFEGTTGGRADVINSSWGFEDSAATTKENRILDALTAANPTVTFVRSAGNGGSTVAPGTGYNGITVGSLGGGGDAVPFRRPSDFSSGKAADFYNPATGVTVTGVRAAVSIAAPGEDFALAAYLGKTGSLADFWPTSNPATDRYFVNQAGTSFSSPVVAGGVALLKDVSYGGVYLSGLVNARDTRVIKSVLMAGARQTLGWNNGQNLVGGVLTTTQGLDYATGAGALNLDEAVAIYVGGTTDVPGSGGGTIAALGWDEGTVTQGSPNDYLFASVFGSGLELTVSLNWFVNESFNAATGEPAPGSFADLNLSVWAVVGGLFDHEVARSAGLYNNSEFLRLPIDAGSYGLRVTFSGNLYDFTGTHTSETYGLAWDVAPVPVVSPVPEPGAWGVVIGLGLAVSIFVRRRVSVETVAGLR